jgi:hypothetical protein
MPSEDAIAATIEQALASARSRPDVAGSLTVMSSVLELRAWLADDHQLVDARAQHWRSLLDDVVQAITDGGPRLRTWLIPDDDDLRVQLVDARKDLTAQRGSLDRALLRRVSSIADRLHARTIAPEARLAAFDDIVDAATGDDLTAARGHARTLAHLGAGVGWPAADFAARLGRAFVPDATPAENLARARDVVGMSRPLSMHVVWLHLHLARVPTGDPVAIGVRVRLFDAERFLADLRDQPTQLATFAPEALSEPNYLDRVVRDVPSTESPAAVLRVEVPHSSLGEALSRARQTAHALSALGVVYGSDPGLWVVDPSYVVFAEGRYASAQFSADAALRLPKFPALALQRDHTAATLVDLGPMLGDHLPVGDSDLRETVQLAEWLQAAQLTTPPPRLLLCDRVIEQVRGWAGVGDLARFVDDHLGPRWAIERIHNTVAQAAWDVAEEIFQRSECEALRMMLGVTGDAFPESVNVLRLLENLDEVRATIGDLDHLDDLLLPVRLRDLHEHTRTPAARRSWHEALIETSQRAERRRRRTRNALVHGGPLVDATVDAVVKFAEQLAFTALGECLTARLTGTDLIDHFLAVRARNAHFATALKEGKTVGEALFPETA